MSIVLCDVGEGTADSVTVWAGQVELLAIALRLAAFEDAVGIIATRIERPAQQVAMSTSAVIGADIERRVLSTLTELSHGTRDLMSSIGAR